MSPGKPSAVLDIALWKDVGRKVEGLITTVENTACEEIFNYLMHVVYGKIRLEIR